MPRNVSSSVSLNPSSCPGPSHGTEVFVCLEYNDIERNSCYELELLVLTWNHRMYGKVLVLLDIPNSFYWIVFSLMKYFWLIYNLKLPRQRMAQHSYVDFRMPMLYPKSEPRDSLEHGQWSWKQGSRRRLLCLHVNEVSSLSHNIGKCARSLETGKGGTFLEMGRLFGNGLVQGNEDTDNVTATAKALLVGYGKTTLGQ